MNEREIERGGPKKSIWTVFVDECTTSAPHRGPPMDARCSSDADVDDDFFFVFFFLFFSLSLSLFVVVVVVVVVVDPFFVCVCFCKKKEFFSDFLETTKRPKLEVEKKKKKKSKEKGSEVKRKRSSRLDAIGNLNCSKK